MPRILVLGAYGAGKSTLADRLSKELAIPSIFLDEEYYLPNWTKPPIDVWRAKTEKLCAQPDWVMDGNFIATLDQRLERATHVIYLRPSRWICIFRVMRRLVRYYNRVRPTVAPECPERFYMPFLASILNFDRDLHPILMAKLAKSNVQVTYLPCKKDIKAYLHQVQRLASKEPKMALRFQS